MDNDDFYAHDFIHSKARTLGCRYIQELYLNISELYPISVTKDHCCGMHVARVRDF